MEQSTLTKILTAVVIIFGPAVIMYVANLYRKAHEWAKKEHWYTIVRDFVKTAVAAAEQLGLTGELEKYADTKLEYAIDHVERMLADNGIRVDLDIPLEYIRDLIEAEVNRM